MTSKHDTLFYKCLFSPDSQETKEGCERAKGGLEIMKLEMVRRELLYGLVPILMAWFLVYIVVWTVRCKKTMVISKMTTSTANPGLGIRLSPSPR